MKGTVRYHSDALPYDVSTVAVPRCFCLFNAHVHNKKDADGLIPKSISLLHPMKNVSVLGVPKLFWLRNPLCLRGGGGMGWECRITDLWHLCIKICVLQTFMLIHSRSYSKYWSLGSWVIRGEVSCGFPICEFQSFLWVLCSKPLLYTEFP